MFRGYRSEEEAIADYIAYFGTGVVPQQSATQEMYLAAGPATVPFAASQARAPHVQAEEDAGGSVVALVIAILVALIIAMFGNMLN